MQEQPPEEYYEQPQEFQEGGEPQEFIPELQEEEQKPLMQRIQERLAASRFFTFSLLLHVGLVMVAGSVVLFKKMTDPPDFVAEGGGPVTETAAAPQEEQPQDLTQETVTPEVPTITPPPSSVTAIVSTNASPTAFQMTAAPMPVAKPIGDGAKMGEMPKALSSGGFGKGLPSTMAGRAGGTARTKASQANKGTEEAEKAVLNGLRWLKANQNADGSWGTANKYAMTGLASLCFLGHGELPESPEFGPTIKKALDWLLEKGKDNDGRFSPSKNSFAGQPTVYEHGIATYAIGEYYTMTKDERFKDLVTKAVGYVVDGQNTDGGWNYSYAKGEPSDTSVSGWQIQALKAGHLTELKIKGVDEALDKAMVNLKRVQGPKGGFGYRGPQDKYSLTGVGVLCTLFWKEKKDETVRKGVEFILEQSEKAEPVKFDDPKADLYAWYYHTQACLMYGGSAWEKWNRMFQKEVITAQSPDGSWPFPPKSKMHGEKVGIVYPTTLCILMLEVFYRYMPINK